MDVRISLYFCVYSWGWRWTRLRMSTLNVLHLLTKAQVGLPSVAVGLLTTMETARPTIIATNRCQQIVLCPAARTAPLLTPLTRPRVEEGRTRCVVTTCSTILGRIHGVAWGKQVTMSPIPGAGTIRTALTGISRTTLAVWRGRHILISSALPWTQPAPWPRKFLCAEKNSLYVAYLLLLFCYRCESCLSYILYNLQIFLLSVNCSSDTCVVASCINTTFCLILAAVVAVAVTYDDDNWLCSQRPGVTKHEPFEQYCFPLKVLLCRMAGAYKFLVSIVPIMSYE